MEKVSLIKRRRLNKLLQYKVNLPDKKSRALQSNRKSLAINPFHEETHVNLASIQYQLFLTHPEKVKLDDIMRRLQFVLSLNPHNKIVQKLIEKIENKPL